MEILKKIRVVNLKDITVAKIDYKGPFKEINKAYNPLMNWAKSNQLTCPKENKTLTIYHDDPKVVGINNVRQSACIIIDKSIEIKATQIKKMAFMPRKCAVARFELNLFEFQNAWLTMDKWVDKLGIELSEHYKFEVYQPKKSRNKSIIDICFPIK